MHNIMKRILFFLLFLSFSTSALANNKHLVYKCDALTKDVTKIANQQDTHFCQNLLDSAASSIHFASGCLKNNLGLEAISPLLKANDRLSSARYYKCKNRDALSDAIFRLEEITNDVDPVIHY